MFKALFGAPKSSTPAPSPAPVAPRTSGQSVDERAAIDAKEKKIADSKKKVIQSGCGSSIKCALCLLTGGALKPTDRGIAKMIKRAESSGEVIKKDESNSSVQSFTSSTSRRTIWRHSIRIRCQAFVIQAGT